MSYEKVALTKNIVIGKNQTIRSIKKQIVCEVLLANDSDFSIIDNVVSVATEYGVPITYVSSMKELGIACGIDVSAATVGILVN